MPEENPRKRSIIPTIITILVVAGLAAGGYYAWMYLLQPAPEPEPAPSVPQEPIVSDLSYASSTMGFSLTYPAEFILDAQFAYTGVSAEKPIYGVKFGVPTALTQGTNLSSESGVSVEVLPRANNCTGDIYLLANVRAQAMTEGAVTYSVASASTTENGTTIEETVYAFPSSSPCIAVRYFLESSAVDATATGTRAFDRASVIAAFDEIRRSIVRTPESGSVELE